MMIEVASVDFIVSAILIAIGTGVAAVVWVGVVAAVLAVYREYRG